jgi:hypothetical protein
MELIFHLLQPSDKEKDYRATLFLFLILQKYYPKLSCIFSYIYL